MLQTVKEDKNQVDKRVAMLVKEKKYYKEMYTHQKENITKTNERKTAQKAEVRTFGSCGVEFNKEERETPLHPNVQLAEIEGLTA